MKKILTTHYLSLLGIGVGALAGYLYYMEVGCHNGSCRITGDPLHSTLYGALMGGLFFNLFEKKPQKKNQES